MFNGKWNKSQRSDVLAQVLRLASILKSKGRLETVPVEKLDILERRLLLFQRNDGGFLYGKDLDLVESNCVNAWSTMIALQAVHMFQSLKKRKEIDIKIFI